MHMLGWMDAVGPEPLGQESVIKQLRPVLFGTILGAATVRPTGVYECQPRPLARLARATPDGSCDRSPAGDPSIHRGHAR